jgi:hypothetical protein
MHFCRIPFCEGVIVHGPSSETFSRRRWLRPIHTFHPNPHELENFTLRFLVYTETSLQADSGKIMYTETFRDDLSTDVFNDNSELRNLWTFKLFVHEGEEFSVKPIKIFFSACTQIRLTVDNAVRCAMCVLMWCFDLFIFVVDVLTRLFCWLRAKRAKISRFRSREYRKPELFLKFDTHLYN